jgi:hypothetical protein
MLREIRNIKPRSKQVFIYYLANGGKIKKHVNEKGYVCYDTEELKEYHKNAKRGRPAKI